VQRHCRDPRRIETDLLHSVDVSLLSNVNIVLDVTCCQRELGVRYGASAGQSGESARQLRSSTCNRPAGAQGN